MFVIGNTTDQTTSIIWSYLSHSPFKISNAILANYQPYQTLFQAFLKPWISNEPLYFMLISLMGSLLGPNAYNIYTLCVFILNFLCFYLVFNKYKFWWFGCLIFNLSSFYYLHVGIHPGLIHLWAFPVFYKLYTEQKLKILPFFILLVTLLSNYIGFILIILMGTLFLSKGIKLLFTQEKDFKDMLFDLKALFFTGLLIFLFLFRFFILNYTKTESTTKDYYVLNRGIVDFTIFSARPWYLFIPSEKNPVLGKFATFENNKVSSVNNYLFKQNFPAEHSALFFGFIFYLMLMYAFFSKKMGKDIKAILLINCTLLFIAMLPPEIILKGRTIYLPSYLIYKLFNVFRVTTRIGVAIHFLLVLFLMQFLETVKKSILTSTLILAITLIILGETFIPLKIRKLNAPIEYKYIAENTKSDAFLNIYPFSRTHEALLWLPVHQRKMTNSTAILYADYDPEKFTETLFDPNNNVAIDYFLVDNKYLNLVPKEFKLIKAFDTSNLYLKNN